MQLLTSILWIKVIHVSESGPRYLSTALGDLQLHCRLQSHTYFFRSCHCSVSFQRRFRCSDTIIRYDRCHLVRSCISLAVKIISNQHWRWNMDKQLCQHTHMGYNHSFYHDVGEISDLSQSEAPNLVMWQVRVMQPTTQSPWRRGRSWPQYNVQENGSMKCH